MDIKEKVKVFISSKCGIEKYDIVREALKCRLEDTGFIDVYVFESTCAYSQSALDSYINKLDDCDLVIFLIDNEEEKFPEGVMKEYLRSKDLNKKSIYLFLNIPGKEETSIQKSLYGPNGPKFINVNNIKEFIEKGYKSVVEDIFSVYKDYCRGRLHNNEIKVKRDIDDYDNIIGNEVESYKVKKNILNRFLNVIEFFKSTNKYLYKNEIKSNNNLEDAFINFAKVILCEEEFEQKKIETLITLIIDLHDDEIKEIIREKWRAIKCCYSENISEAIDILDKAYKKGISDKKIDWIINDILIDKRNLEYLLNREKNIISKSDAQKCLDLKDDVLYYPVLDRLSQNIYSNINKERNNNEMMTPYTSSFGTGIDNILEDIGQYFVWAVYYGSYTHIKIVIRLLQDVYFNFYKIYDLNEWGFEALRYSILNKNSDITKDICDRNSKIISACSMDKISELYNMSNRVDFKYDMIKLKLNIFGALGYYFSDEKYMHIENEIFNIINEWVYSQNVSVYLGQEIFSSIKNNVQRIKIKEIVNFFNRVFYKKLYRFYDNVFEIISMIPCIKINEEILDNLVDEIINIVKDVDNRYKYNNLKHCIVYIRKTTDKFNDILDETININWKEVKDIYYLEVLKDKSNDCKSITKYLEEIRKRNSIQGNSGYYSYSYYPANIIQNILRNSKLSILDQSLLSEIINVCQECLNNDKQIISEKISCIYLLIYVKKISIDSKIEYNWNRFYNSIKKNDSILKGYKDEFLEKSSELTLYFNYLMLKFSNEDVDEKELLEVLTYYNDNNAYEIINLIESITCFLENSSLKESYKNIYSILLQTVVRFINDKNYEIRYKVANCLFKFPKNISNEIIYRYIEIISDDKDYRVKLAILNNIKYQKNKMKYKYIIEKCSVDNNYLVNRIAKKIYNEL